VHRVAGIAASGLIAAPGVVLGHNIKLFLGPP